MRLELRRRDRAGLGVHLRSSAIFVIGCALLLDTACGSDSAATAQGDAAVGPDSPGIMLAQRANALAVANHSTQCSFCTCHSFVPASTKCEAALLDTFEPAKRMVVCEIAAAEQMEACLSLAQSCTDAKQCEATEQTQTAKCPTVDPLELPPQPSGC